INSAFTKTSSAIIILTDLITLKAFLMQKKLKNSSSVLWNKKAKQYARFSQNKNTFQHNILEKIAQRGIHFEGKTVLDIGCGTGIYTLLIANLAHKVMALDFSQEMLTILEIDARNENLLSKISFTCKAWDAYEEEERFDISFSSMSPAFKSDEDFEKMHDSAKEYCVYLGWGGKRESEVLNEVFQAHGLKLKSPLGSQNLKEWLERKKITYLCEYIEDEWNTLKSEEEAIESVLWHLEINEAKADVSLVKKIIHQRVDALGFVNFKVKVGLELISWEK
ncbi:MAG: methyltransferase domain-containing protein, partial [Campylobacteraceae bacterium]|nr:methyltransferase domain-containing protein [Campylobacteraceae bacterium]